MTQFIHTEVSLAHGVRFTIDGNSKITAGNGTYESPAPNALSLPHISTCPGATDSCMNSCYIHGLRASAGNVYATYERNQQAVLRALALPRGFRRAISTNLGSWIDRNCADGFRWHVSGDVMSVDHALWIADVARSSPKVRHWIYTRSLFAVPHLVSVPNLAVNISADRDNWFAARVVHDVHPTTRLCYMAQGTIHPGHLPDGSVIFPDYQLRGRDLEDPTDAPWWRVLPTRERQMVCPADFFGQSATHRCGPCQKCLLPRVVS